MEANIGNENIKKENLLTKKGGKVEIILDKSKFGISQVSKWKYAFFDKTPYCKKDKQKTNTPNPLAPMAASGRILDKEERLITVSDKPYLIAVTDDQYKWWNKKIIVRKHRFFLTLARVIKKIVTFISRL